MLEASRFEHEFGGKRSDFTPEDVQKLRHALQDGRAFLAKTWEHPVGNVKRRCLKKKAEIVKVIEGIITRDKASDALYTTCFPNHVIVEHFVAAKQQEAAEREARKKRDYDSVEKVGQQCFAAQVAKNAAAAASGHG